MKYSLCPRLKCKAALAARIAEEAAEAWVDADGYEEYAMSMLAARKRTGAEALLRAPPRRLLRRWLHAPPRRLLRR